MRRYFLSGLILAALIVMLHAELAAAPPPGNLVRTMTAPRTRVVNSDDRSLELSTFTWSPERSPFSTMTLRILNRSEQDRTVEIYLKGNIGYRKQVTVPAGKTIHTNVFMPMSGMYTFLLSGNRLDIECRRAGLKDYYNVFVEYFQETGIDRAVPARPEDIEGISWRHFASLDQIQLKSGIWDSLPQSAQNALLDWCGIGGVLTIDGADIQSLMKKYPPDFDMNAMHLPAAGASAAERYGLGNIRSSANDTAKSSLTADRRNSRWTPDWKTFGINPYIVVPAIIIFGLVVGPGTILFCRIMKRPALAVALIPALSLIACAAIVVIALFSDGITPKVSFSTAAYLNQISGRAYVRQITGIETPIGMSEPVSVSEDSIIIFPGIGKVSTDVGLPSGTVNIENGKAELGSFIRPRIPFVFYSARLEPRRERLEITEDTARGTMSVINGLGSDIGSLVVCDSKGAFFGTPDIIPAGSKAELKRIHGKEIPETFSNPADTDDMKLCSPAPLARGTYQAHLAGNVFGELSMKNFKRVGENRHIVIGRYWSPLKSSSISNPAKEQSK